MHMARNELFDLEDLDEEELERLQKKFSLRARRKRAEAGPSND